MRIFSLIFFRTQGFARWHCAPEAVWEYEAPDLGECQVMMMMMMMIMMIIMMIMSGSLDHEAGDEDQDRGLGHPGGL